MTIQLTGSLQDNRNMACQVRGIMTMQDEEITLRRKGDGAFCIDWGRQRTNIYSMPENWQFVQGKYQEMVASHSEFAAYQAKGYNVRTVMDGIQSQEQYERAFGDAINISTPLALFDWALQVDGTISISEEADTKRGSLHICMDYLGAFANTFQLLNDKFIHGKEISVKYKEDASKYYVTEAVDAILVQENDPLWDEGMYSGKLGRGSINGIYHRRICSNREIMAAELAYMMPHILIVNPRNEHELCPASEVYPHLVKALWKHTYDMERKASTMKNKRRDAIDRLLLKNTKLRYAFAAAANVYAFYRIHSVHCIAYAGALYSAAYLLGWRRILSDFEGEQNLNVVHEKMREFAGVAWFFMAYGVALWDTLVEAIRASKYNLYSVAQALYSVVTLKPLRIVASHLYEMQGSQLGKLIVCGIPYLCFCIVSAVVYSGMCNDEMEARGILTSCVVFKHLISNGILEKYSPGKLFWEPIDLSAANYVFVSSIVVFSSMRYVLSLSDAEIERNHWHDDILRGVKGVFDVFMTIALCNDSGCYDRLCDGLSALGR